MPSSSRLLIGVGYDVNAPVVRLLVAPYIIWN